MDIAPIYAQRSKERQDALRVLEGQSYRIAVARVVTFVAPVALVAAIVWAPLDTSWWSAVAALVAAFVALVFVDNRLDARKSRVAAACRFYERGIARMEGRWHDFPSTGARFKTGDHPYADDLDVFGPSSLFQLLDGTQTKFGEEYLAALLKGEGREPFPQVVVERQVAAQDLAERLDFRENLFALGAIVKSQRPDPTSFLAWAEGGVPFPLTAPVLFASRALPALALLVFLAAPLVHLPRTAALLVVAVELVVSRVLGLRVAQVAAAAGSQEQSFVRFAAMVDLVEREAFSAPALVALRDRLKGSGAQATVEMNRLSRIVAFLDARNNEFFRFFMGPVFMWDLNCAIALEKWRLRVGRRTRGWFQILGEMEALASLASFAAEHPAYAWPSLEGEGRYEAVALGHPLIADAKRVCNDVSLKGKGTALIVTGSNMSGKSTLMRAMGINTVLALAGAPVCARSFGLGSVAVFTSMRVSDSLEHGVSHFYAEVEKLKRVLDMARADTPVLFFLDEILHGTNSRERLIGARAVVKELLARGALGAVSTHDLGLGDLEKELPGQARNVHFEEQVEGDKMTFDYGLREGVVTSSNALRLMRMVGITVVPLE